MTLAGSRQTAGERESTNALRELAQQMVSVRDRPLLVMFYPDDLHIEEEQIEHLHALLKSRGLRKSAPLDALDVLIHTYGGDPTAAYRLAQVIRNFANEVDFLVPEYAFSGGTLVCLSGGRILMGDYAVLSPIDITIYRSSDDPDQDQSGESGEQEDEGIELVAIDHFIKLAVRARIEMEREFERQGLQDAESNAESEMLQCMVEELGIIEIGQLYRQKDLTQVYANELLTSYMFAGEPGSDATIERILSRLIVEAPSHDFAMDYHICHDVGLKVEEMDEELADCSTELTKRLQTMAERRLICRKSRGTRLPFFDVFHPTQTVSD